jgi:two-component system, NtrC family, sensor kinase
LDNGIEDSKFSGILSDRIVPDNLKCLTMLATAGQLPEWNSRHQSVGHKAIPLANEKAIAHIPMIYQLIQQLGLNPGIVVQPDPNLLTDLEQKMYTTDLPTPLTDLPTPSTLRFLLLPCCTRASVNFILTVVYKSTIP